MLDLFFDKELLGDIQFLQFGITGQSDNLHPVLQSNRDIIKSVRRSDKKYFREIIVKIEVMVTKGEILFRIQNLQKGCRRITAKIGAHLVHLIQTEDRVVRLRLLQILDDLPGQGADIGSPVPPYFSLIPHPAQRETNKIAASCPGNRSGQGGFADSRRSHHTEDGALDLFGQTLDGQILEYPLFRFSEAIVVLFQDRFGIVYIHLFFCALFPGKCKNPIHVIAYHGGFGRHRRHHFQFFKFLPDPCVGLFGHSFSFDSLFNFIKFCFKIIRGAHLFLDGPHLLIEIIILLGLLHLFFDSFFQTAFQREDMYFIAKVFKKFFKPAVCLYNLQ